MKGTAAAASPWASDPRNKVQEKQKKIHSNPKADVYPALTALKLAALQLSGSDTLRA